MTTRGKTPASGTDLPKGGTPWDGMTDPGTESPAPGMVPDAGSGRPAAETPRTGGRPAPIERVAAVLAVLALAVPAFAGSFAHVQHVAAEHGQAGWLSLAFAGSPEVLALLAAMEVRRRRGWRRLVVLAVLVVAVVLTVAANLATADGTTWGVVAAGWPAAAFLLVVLVVETRPRTEVSQPLSRPAPHGTAVGTEDEPEDDGTPLPARNADVLLEAGRLVLADLTREGLVLTRDRLVSGLRDRDVRVGTARATELLHTLRAQNGHAPEVPR